MTCTCLCVRTCACTCMGGTGGAILTRQRINGSGVTFFQRGMEVDRGTLWLPCPRRGQSRGVFHTVSLRVPSRTEPQSSNEVKQPALAFLSALYFPACSLVIPGLTSQRNYLYPNPCFRIYFGEKKSKTRAIYGILTDLEVLIIIGKTETARFPALAIL